MELFYHATIPLTLDSVVQFNTDESLHIAKSLRKMSGDTIFVTDGAGVLAQVQLTVVNKRQTQGILIKRIEPLPPKPGVHLAVGIPRSNDRLEFLVEKTTELNVQRISLLKTAHTEKVYPKPDRLRKIMRNASKQSLRTVFPILDDPMTFKDWITTEQSEHRFICYGSMPTAHALPYSQHIETLSRHLPKGESATILIGPEGGFTAEEVAIAVEHGYQVVQLGPQRLRVETAAIFVVSMYYEKQHQAT